MRSRPTRRERGPCRETPRAMCLLAVAALSAWAAAAGAAEEQARVTVTILDAETDEPTPARVHLADADGNAVDAPDDAIAVMYGRNDRAEGYRAQPDGSFYVDGRFTTTLAPGRYTLSVEKGYEYLRQTHTLTVDPGETLTREYALERWVDMPSRGWYSADDHIHIRRSPRTNPKILKWVAAEDVHVGILLQMGDFWATYFSQYAFGKEGNYREERTLLTSGQEEPRTHEIGHTISFGAEKFVRHKSDYYLYDKVFDRVHALGGLTGYAHQGETFHAYRGMTLDVLRDKVDFLELLQFCAKDGPLITEHYYHFLDLGFELTATGGSDFPWCGKGPRFGVEGPRWNPRIGNARFYTYVGEKFTYQRWEKAVRSGRTFVSSGPVLDFVNGERPGGHVELDGPSELTIVAEAEGHPEQVPLETLEVVGHGEVLQKVDTEGDGQSKRRLRIEMDHRVDHGIWLAARCQAGPLQVAHTTPVYVTVDGDGFHDPEDAPRRIRESRGHLDEIEKAVSGRRGRVFYQGWRYKKGLQKRIEEARKVLDRLEDELR